MPNQPPPRPRNVFRGSSVVRQHRDRVMEVIRRIATHCERRYRGNMVSSYEVCTWTIPGGSAVWTQGRWGQPESLYVEEAEARARILAEMGIGPSDGAAP
jgi:hypothetical protein